MCGQSFGGIRPHQCAIVFYSAIFDELDVLEYFGIESIDALNPEQTGLFEQLEAIHARIPAEPPPQPGEKLTWACPIEDTQALLARCASGDITVFPILARSYLRDHHALTGLQSLCYLDFIDPLRVDFESDIETAANAFRDALNALQRAGEQLDATRLHRDLMWIGQQGQLTADEEVAPRRMAFALRVIKSIQIPPTDSEIQVAAQLLQSRLDEQKAAFHSEIPSLRMAGAPDRALASIVALLEGESETVLSTEEAQRALSFFAEIAGKRRLRDPDQMQVLEHSSPNIAKVLGDWEWTHSRIHSTLMEVLNGRLNGEWELNMQARRILTAQVLVLRLLAAHASDPQDRRFAAAYVEEWDK
ncbi:MAG: hypothetical protein KDD51_04050 [Bdellovibrionales bacterium]|nr:hypothetical protein [Bdellovibrionales bacterium]